MKLNIAAVLFSLSMGLGACGSGSGVPSTLGGYCRETGAAACKSMVKCTSGVSASTCEDLFMQGCCEEEGTCSRSVSGIDEAAYSQCKKDLASMSCVSIDNEVFPSSCQSM